MTWDSWGGQDGSGNGIYGQRYDSAGVAVGSEFQVNSYTDNNQEYSSTTGLNDGGFVVTWSSHGQDGSDWGIYVGKGANRSGAGHGWSSVGHVAFQTYVLHPSSLHWPLHALICCAFRHSPGFGFINALGKTHLKGLTVHLHFALR